MHRQIRVTQAHRQRIIARVVPASRSTLFLCGLGIAACGSSGSTVDAAGDVLTLDVPAHVDDGTPTRMTCTNTFGSELTQTFGRLDGILVAIVPVGANGCNGDSGHVHLQVKMHGAIYDVAVNVGTQGASDVGTTTREVWLGNAWNEGWHTGTSINYIAMGVHSTDLIPKPSAQNASEVMTDLASANHISIFGTGYGPDGMHLVHRGSASHDGLIVTDPLSAPVHARMFAFSDQTF